MRFLFKRLRKKCNRLHKHQTEVENFLLER